MGFICTRDEVVAEADGSFNAVEAYAFEFALATAVFHHFEDDGEADAVAFYFGGHCCKCWAAFVLLVGKVVKPLGVFVHCFFGEAYGLGFPFVWDFKDLADDVAPGTGDVLGDFIVVEFWV